MRGHFADKLLRTIGERGTCACVGIDPVFERFPAALQTGQYGHTGQSGHTGQADHNGQSDHRGRAVALFAFCKGVIDVVAERVPVIKLNIAFFEPYRGPGIEAYYEAVRYAHERGLLVIGDIKRGDIGHSSASYAAAHLVGDGPDDLSIPDAVTISAYLGIDGVSPFVEAANETGRGVFVLVHTSNVSAAQLQHLSLQSGNMVVEDVAALVHTWGQASVGDSGYSNIGAVAAPGDLKMARKLRELMPGSIFLVPGFGAQGRSVEQVAACFDAKGQGAIVNASRSVIYAYEKQAGDEWTQAVERACDEFVNALDGIASIP